MHTWLTFVEKCLKLYLSGWVGGWVGGWSYSDYKAKLRSIAIAIASWN
jgi:hypothetical protein